VGLIWWYFCTTFHEVRTCRYLILLLVRQVSSIDRPLIIGSDYLQTPSVSWRRVSIPHQISLPDVWRSTTMDSGAQCAVLDFMLRRH
jgi:hypothetical protein